MRKGRNKHKPNLKVMQMVIRIPMIISFTGLMKRKKRKRKRGKKKQRTMIKMRKMIMTMKLSARKQPNGSWTWITKCYTSSLS